MANRVATASDTGNTTYSNWIANEGLPPMQVGDIILDDYNGGGGPDLFYFVSIETTFSGASSTPTVWLDTVTEGTTFRGLTFYPSDGNEWDRTITVRPLLGQVVIERDAIGPGINIKDIKHVIIDGELNSYPGLRNGGGTFLNNTFGIKIEGKDDVSQTFMGIDIDNDTTGSTDKTVVIRGVEIEHGFAGIRINAGGSGVFPIMSGVTIERIYRHDASNGEGLYFGWTGSEAAGFTKFKQLIIRNNVIARSATEALQFQHMNDASLRTEIYNNILIGGVDWIAPFASFQDNNSQMLAIDGNIRIYNNIFDQGGDSMLFLASNNSATANTITDVVRYKNNLFIRGKNRGLYFDNSLTEGITWEFVNNFFIKFNNDYSDKPSTTAATHVVANGSTSDDVIFINNTKDNTRSTWYAGGAFGVQEIDNANNNTGLTNPSYNLTGIDYDNFKGIWGDSWNNDDTNFVTWASGDTVSYMTDGIGTRFYVCISAHTSTISSSLTADTGQWTQLTWDASGIRNDEVGWSSGDTQSNIPPDNFNLSSTDFWNSLDMGLPYNDELTGNTFYRWYYADDASGTNKVRIYGEKEATIDLNDSRNEWIVNKTGKYLIGSVTPVDISGNTGTEKFALGIAL